MKIPDSRLSKIQHNLDASSWNPHQEADRTMFENQNSNNVCSVQCAVCSVQCAEERRIV